jgi:hypothetical protein
MKLFSVFRATDETGTFGLPLEASEALPEWTAGLLRIPLIVNAGSGDRDHRFRSS